MKKKVRIIVFSLFALLCVFGTAHAKVAPDPPDFSWLIGAYKGAYDGTWGGAPINGEWTFALFEDGTVLCTIEGVSGSGQFDFNTGYAQLILDGIGPAGIAFTEKGTWEGAIPTVGAKASGALDRSGDVDGVWKVKDGNVLLGSGTATGSRATASGDADDNGLVNMSDYRCLRGKMGAQAGQPAYTFNGDMNTDGKLWWDDLRLLIRSLRGR